MPESLARADMTILERGAALEICGLLLVAICGLRDI